MAKSIIAGFDMHPAALLIDQIIKKNTLILQVLQPRMAQIRNRPVSGNRPALVTEVLFFYYQIFIPKFMV
ncbi:MAG: hypothetical protein MI921_23490 [Cytophagales bacterium]|nr:hypothetical protein [Cytophagales bacterium]